MNTRTPANQSKRTQAIGLLCIGVLLLVIAAFVNPIGSSPDTGVLDFGSSGTKWLLGAFGAVFVAAGIGTFIKAKYSK